MHKNGLATLAAANQWSVSELQRQIANSFYERLALSREK